MNIYHNYHRNKINGTYYLIGECKLTGKEKVIISGLCHLEAHRLKRNYYTKQYFKKIKVRFYESD